MTVAGAGACATRLNNCPLRVSGSVKSGAIVPKGSMLDSVYAIGVVLRLCVEERANVLWVKTIVVAHCFSPQEKK